MTTRKIAYNVRSLNRRWQRLSDAGLPGAMETHGVMLDIQTSHPAMRRLTDNPMRHVKHQFHWRLTNRQSGDFLWVAEMRRGGWTVEVPTIASNV